MTQTGALRLEQLGRLLLRGVCIGASTVTIVELLRNDWTDDISPGGASGCVQGPIQTTLEEASQRRGLLQI